MVEEKRTSLALSPLPPNITATAQLTNEMPAEEATMYQFYMFLS